MKGLGKHKLKSKAEISTPSISVRLVISVYAMLELHMPLRVTWARGLVEVLSL